MHMFVYSREMIGKPETSPGAFWFLYTTLSININNECGLSNRVHRELLLQKSNCIFHSFHTKSCVTSCCIMQVAKLIKEDGPIVVITVRISA